MFCIDFSENYVAKYNEEVQSVHFGASKRQISLNTGVFYLKGTDNKLKAKSFCTLSDNLDHQAHAVWAHMAPILKMVSRNHPETVAVHFFSDSPSSQYRNRFNMHLMKTKVPMFFKKVKYITWNFMEAGHGKGPMDGVGGAMKRRADEYVMHGSDITSARDFINTFKKSNIYITEIANADVIEKKREVQTKTVQPISCLLYTSRCV